MATASAFHVLANGPFVSAAAVTPNDTGSIAANCRGLYIGGAGAVKVDMNDGTTVTFSAVPVGTVLNIRVNRVYATGTTATLILALF